MSTYVDWEFAKAAAARVVPPGPRIGAHEAAAEVEAIREAARAAYTPVAETARLNTPAGAAPALVVDRRGWIAANVDSLAALVDPAISKAVEGRPAPSAAVAAVGSRMTGAEVGGLLAFMAGKVLGQYDLAPQGEPQLLLVAPNIVEVAGELDIDRDDFRMWVCLHEETHRVQFTAVPWLREHLVGRARDLAVDLTPDVQAVGDLAKRITQRLPEVLSGAGTGLVDLFLTAEQRAEVAELTAVMSLLEGHADVVMDDVGPAYVPSVAQIRAKFSHRRQGAGAADRLLRRLLGLEAKMRQYAEGAAFVRGVQELVGVDGFNAVWSSPQTLPQPEEIADPAAWVSRVHG